MRIIDHFTSLLRNLYPGQEATVRTEHGTRDWFQTGKGVCQGCILSPCLFNLFAEYFMWNAGLDESQLESRLLGEGSTTSEMQMIPLVAESEEELNSFSMRVKEKSEKAGVKAQHSKNEDHGFWSHHFMANRWGSSGNSVRLYLLRLQNHCRWWLQPLDLHYR